MTGCLKPFGWEVLELRYGGLRARLETMHVRLMAFLDSDDVSVTRLEELEVRTEAAYPGSGCMMMLGEPNGRSVAFWPLTDDALARLSSRFTPHVLLSARSARRRV